LLRLFRNHSDELPSFNHRVETGNHGVRGVHPARYQYREVCILAEAFYEGKPVSYGPYIFVDNDAAMARGWTQGYPKRLGQVFQTRYDAATGKAGPALAPGAKFAGSL